MSGLMLLCSAPHAGTLAQVRAIADTFQNRSGLAFDVRLHSWRDDLAAALLPPRARRGRPSILISCARAGERRARRQKKADPSAFWVHVETLKQPGVQPDLLVIPQHDWLPEMEGRLSVLPVLGAPHGVAATGLAPARETVRARHGIAATTPVSIFLIGGPNPAFDYDTATVERILDSIAAAAAAGHRCFVSASRRTPPALHAHLAALGHPRITVWDGVSANPYRDYLAMGDQFLVTEDSITMTCEAVATGRQVSWLSLEPRPGAALDKFRRFHGNWSPYVTAPVFAGASAVPGPPRVDLPDDAGKIVARMLALMGRG